MLTETASGRFISIVLMAALSVVAINSRPALAVRHARRALLWRQNPNSNPNPLCYFRLRKLSGEKPELRYRKAEGNGDGGYTGLFPRSDLRQHS